jgi:Tfp pilus assembly protein PilN
VGIADGGGGLQPREGGVKPLNLASRPFRNETLATTVVALAAVAVLGLTVAHGLSIRRLRSARVSAVQREAAELEAETARLQAEAGELRAPRPAADALAEWAALKDLVDRRSFSWTDLFAQLEAVLPPDVRLQSITPRLRRGRFGLDLITTTRSPQAGLEFMRILEAADAFEDVFPPQVDPAPDGTRFSYTMTYRPPASSPSGAPAPAARSGNLP